MGLGRVELPTSRLSGVRSNHLSYSPHGDEPRKVVSPRKSVNARSRMLLDTAADARDDARQPIMRRPDPVAVRSGLDNCAHGVSKGDSIVTSRLSQGDGDVSRPGTITIDVRDAVKYVTC